MFFLFKQKTAYEMRISDWISDVCSSDLPDDGCIVYMQGMIYRMADCLARGGRIMLPLADEPGGPVTGLIGATDCDRSEEHTSELQSLMRISYAVFCLKKKKTKNQHTQLSIHQDTNIQNT